MKAIIPVAGHGTRLEPHTLKLQKCLLPVGGKPVLEHLLDRIIKVGVTDVTLVIGHLGEIEKELEELAKRYLKLANKESLFRKKALKQLPIDNAKELLSNEVSSKAGKNIIFLSLEFHLFHLANTYIQLQRISHTVQIFLDALELMLQLLDVKLQLLHC